MQSLTRIVIKLVLSIVIFLIAAFVNSAVMQSTGRHVTSGVGFIIFPAAIIAIVAIWKYNPLNNSGEKHDLKKD